MAAQTLEKPRSATHEVLNQSVPRVGFDEMNSTCRWRRA